MNITPDLLTFQDGSAVDAPSWLRRRKELSEVILPQQFGGMPPKHKSIDVIRLSATIFEPRPTPAPSADEYPDMTVSIDGQR